jgi:hypothetical protein
MPPLPPAEVTVVQAAAPPDIHVTLENPVKPVTRHITRDKAGLITAITDG